VHDVSLGEVKLAKVAFLHLLSKCGWNGTTLAVLWPWRARSMRMRDASIPEYPRLGMAA
jgi:hypothetical protein